MDWDSALFGVSAGMWTALAAWLAVVVGIAALIYAWRQYRRARQQAAEAMQPNVAMYMEPAANDWHLVELVVRNFGRTPAYGIRFDFANPPTVAKYENVYDDGHVDVVPLNLPAEIPYLAPGQEWRIVWDSALDRRELGEGIASRFDGAVTYDDKPGAQDKKRGRFKTSAVLDWSTLHPVERLELLTTHDLARQEKQKLELLRHVLTYYHYAAGESREDVLRGEIEKVRAAADELRDRYQEEAAQAPQVSQTPPEAPQAPQTGHEAYQSTHEAYEAYQRPPQASQPQPQASPPSPPPPQAPPPQPPSPASPPSQQASQPLPPPPPQFEPPDRDFYRDADPDFEEAHTQVIDTTARHRRR